MFGSSSPFGQSSSSPFGTPSGFGATSNQSNNPFAPQPFGGTSPFGAQTGSSIFGGTSTGVFGATQSSSPFSSTTTFGASSSPAFGSSAPAFGASSTPSAFGGFGKPAFGGFGSTPSQPSPFGSTSQPSQPAFGSTSQPSQPAFGSGLFGSSTAFGAPSQPAFGASSTPAFGTSSTPAFGSSSTPAFGATSTPAFGTTPTTSLFGASSSPAFGAPASTPAFGTSTASAFGVSSSPAFSFASSPAYGGQSTSAFGNTGFGTSSSSPFGAQSSPFGAQSTTPTFGGSGAFGQSPFGGQRGGSRVAPFAPTPEPESSGAGASAGRLESISAMPVYKDKSHEELRWEDYQLGDKGGPMASQQPAGIFSTPAQPNFLAASQSQPSSGMFSNTSTATNMFAPKAQTTLFNSTGFATSLSSSSVFNPTPTTPSPFGVTSAPMFSNTSSSLFPSSSPGFTSSSFATQGSAPAFNTGLFNSASPITQPNNAFGQTTSGFGTGMASTFNNQSSIFSAPSTGFASLFSSTPSLSSTPNSLPFSQTTSLFPTSFPAAQPAQPSFAFNSQQQQANGGGGGAASGMFGNLQSSGAVQAVPASNPFGTLPAMPQVSIGRGGTSPSLQYGISSMPVLDKSAPLRISSLLTSRHLSQRRIRLPARKYHPKTDSTKVPFFSDDEETAGTPKADALYLPRENPRALVIRPAEQWPLKASAEKSSPFKDTSPMHQNGDGVGEERESGAKANGKANGVHDTARNGHRAGEAAIVYEHGAGIEALMPKLRRSDYYTEPRVQELAAKERADPGYCRRVTDFVVGRHGFGRIKFLGETDVRGIDLDSVVQFNNREVIVYMDDDAKKPPVGQGLNKPAEVTLLNIKCFNKKMGREYTEGPSVERYKEMLRRKTEDQGAEFVSYDPIKGEWKFRVKHFSRYHLSEDGEEDTFNAPVIEPKTA